MTTSIKRRLKALEAVQLTEQNEGPDEISLVGMGRNAEGELVPVTEPVVIWRRSP